PRPCRLAIALLLLPAAVRAQDSPPVLFADDFAADPRPGYEVTGAVAWQKGRLTLAAGARLQRPAALGFHADVRAVVRFAAGQDKGYLHLRLSDGQTDAAAGLVRADGRTFLVNQSGPPTHRVALAGPADGAWELRLEVR